MPAAIRSLPEGTTLHVNGLAGTHPSDRSTGSRPTTAARTADTWASFLPPGA
jgi:hypothetical protein